MKILVLRVALPEHFLACSSRGIGNLMIQCQSHQKIEHEEHAARSPAQLPQAANTQASRHIVVSNAHPPPTPLATSYRIQPQHSCDFRATSHSSVPTASKSTPTRILQHRNRLHVGSGCASAQRYYWHCWTLLQHRSHQAPQQRCPPLLMLPCRPWPPRLARQPRRCP